MFPSSYNTISHPRYCLNSALHQWRKRNSRENSISRNTSLEVTTREFSITERSQTYEYYAYIPLNEFVLGFEALARELYRFSVNVSLRASSSFVVLIYSRTGTWLFPLLPSFIQVIEPVILHNRHVKQYEIWRTAVQHWCVSMLLWTYWFFGIFWISISYELEIRIIWTYVNSMMKCRC